VTTPSSHGRSGRPWRRLREQVLREEPWCTLCGRRPSTQVDHILPLSQYPELAHERTNLRGSCARCNARRGAAMTNGRAQPKAPPQGYHNPRYCTKNEPSGCVCVRLGWQT
jgi:5-methylcytosine-specific restriction endonuclease McrA